MVPENGHARDLPRCIAGFWLWLLAVALQKMLQKLGQCCLIFPCIVSLPWFIAKLWLSSFPLLFMWSSSSEVKGAEPGGLPQPLLHRVASRIKGIKLSALWNPSSGLLGSSHWNLSWSFIEKVLSLFFHLGVCRKKHVSIVIPPHSFRKDKYYYMVGKAKQRLSLEGLWIMTGVEEAVDPVQSLP